MTVKPPHPRLDEGALDRLRELDPDGRHGVLQRVLQAFEASLTRLLLQLAGELGQGRVGTVCGVAHMLKSSAASVGALALAQACSEIEAARRDGDAAGLDVDVRRLLQEGGLALGAVRAMLRP